MKPTLDHIRKEYDGRPVLQDCSCIFPEGRTTVLMGANGSGKSTLLRICALIEQPDGGSVSFSEDGIPLARTLELHRRVTLVLPRIGVFNASVFLNVAYGLRIRGARKPDLDVRVRRALAVVGLEHKAHQHARTLSSGETQRMGIARALAVEPEVLFLDEPTASVDEENTALIENVIRSLRAEGRTTVIMTSHDRDQAERLADRRLVLEHGVLREPPR